MITVTDVWRIYIRGQIESIALGGVSLSIKEGEFLCCAGASGSGKTTLLSLIGTLDQPSRGTIRIYGEDVCQLSRRNRALFRRKHIGFVFQASNLLPVLSVAENIEYPLILNGISGKERCKRVSDVLEGVGLSHEAKKRPHELSGGQQQRVAIARAIVHRPSIILADEPTGSLDSDNGRRVMDVFREVSKQYGTTCLFSSHDPEIINMADKVVVLKDGRILQSS